MLLLPLLLSAALRFDDPIRFDDFNFPKKVSRKRLLGCTSNNSSIASFHNFNNKIFSSKKLRKRAVLRPSRELREEKS